SNKKKGTNDSGSGCRYRRLRVRVRSRRRSTRIYRVTFSSCGKDWMAAAKGPRQCDYPRSRGQYKGTIEFGERIDLTKLKRPAQEPAAFRFSVNNRAERQACRRN